MHIRSFGSMIVAFAWKYPGYLIYTIRSNLIMTLCVTSSCGSFPSVSEEFSATSGLCYQWHLQTKLCSLLPDSLVSMSRSLMAYPKQRHRRPLPYATIPTLPSTRVRASLPTRPGTAHRRRVTRPRPQRVKVDVLIQATLFTMQTRYSRVVEGAQIQHCTEAWRFGRRAQPRSTEVVCV